MEDYDEEDDNDYEANYFDNGEEDNDDLGDGGGGDDGGDGGCHFASLRAITNFVNRRIRLILYGPFGYRGQILSY